MDEYTQLMNLLMKRDAEKRKFYGEVDPKLLPIMPTNYSLGSVMLIAQEAGLTLSDEEIEMAMNEINDYHYTQLTNESPIGNQDQYDKLMELLLKREAARNLFKQNNNLGRPLISPTALAESTVQFLATEAGLFELTFVDIVRATQYVNAYNRRLYDQYQQNEFSSATK